MQIIEHPTLHITTFTKNVGLPYMLFVHGGPGLNSAILEQLILHEDFFSSLDVNLVLYDQRECGRSKKTGGTVLHEDNIDDLNGVIKLLIEKHDFTIAAIAGHSYGAKLLFDYVRLSKSNIPSIFISTASSILIPRINNLLLDLAYLKSVDSDEYQKVLDEFDDCTPSAIWQITERLSKVFQENETRQYFYWANLFWKKRITEIQDSISQPMNADVFKSVRQDLYGKQENCSVNITTLKSCYLWINGFHDLIMEGASVLTEKKSPIKVFFKSAHYPHIEEHDKFCREVNEFLKNY